MCFALWCLLLWPKLDYSKYLFCIIGLTKICNNWISSARFDLPRMTVIPSYVLVMDLCTHRLQWFSCTSTTERCGLFVRTEWSTLTIAQEWKLCYYETSLEPFKEEREVNIVQHTSTEFQQHNLIGWCGNYLRLPYLKVLSHTFTDLLSTHSIYWSPTSTSKVGF